MSFGTRIERHTDRFATVTRYIPIVRADLTSPRRIRSVMADDLNRGIAAWGHIDHEAMLLTGWTAAQISEHFEAARTIARRRAGGDNGGLA